MVLSYQHEQNVRSAHSSLISLPRKGVCISSMNDVWLPFISKDISSNPLSIFLQMISRNYTFPQTFEPKNLLYDKFIPRNHETFGFCCFFNLLILHGVFPSILSISNFWQISKQLSFFHQITWLRNSLSFNKQSFEEEISIQKKT